MWQILNNILVEKLLLQALMPLGNLDFPFDFLSLHSYLADNHICIRYIHNFSLLVISKGLALVGKTIVPLTFSIQTLF